MARDKVKRAFTWIRKTLRIIDRTTLPGEILGEIRPTLDTFGWERLPEATVLTSQAANPGVAVASATPDIDTLRLVLHASLEHGDTGVSQTASLLKRRNPGALDVGLPVDRPVIIVGEFMSMIGTTFLVNNDFIIAEMLTIPAAGSMTLRLWVIDLPFGEYIPPV
ncbi:MAG: hypothetical protein V3S43_06630 [Acidimicrobiia bacterium]